MENFVFEELPRVKSIGDLRKFEKIKGYANCYKARFGSYRIGVILDGDVMELKRVMDRKSIYKFFP